MKTWYNLHTESSKLLKKIKCGCLGKSWLSSLIHAHTLLFWHTGGTQYTATSGALAGFLGLALMQLINVIVLFQAVKVVPAFRELFLESTNRNEDEHEWTVEEHINTSTTDIPCGEGLKHHLRCWTEVVADPMKRWWLRRMFGGCVCIILNILIFFKNI